jgi:integrase
MDRLFLRAGIAKKGRGCHSLRHTCGALLYQATRDVKVVLNLTRPQTVTAQTAGRQVKAMPVEQKEKDSLFLFDGVPWSRK